MRAKRWDCLVLCLAVIGVLLTGCGESAIGMPAIRVLFVGNSFTDYNGGLDRAFHGLAPDTVVERVAPGGYTLEQHLADNTTMRRVREGNWTYVVLQEQSQFSVVANDRFAAALLRLTSEVRNVHATPVVLMTWARPDDRRITTAALTRRITAAGAAAKASVIPAGTAFAASLAAHPDVVLTQQDGHPNPAGTYLAACTVYAKVLGLNPVGNGFTGGLDATVARSLQETAQASVHP